MLIEGNKGVLARAKILQEEVVGALLLTPTQDDATVAVTWRSAFAHAFQGKLEVEHARRAIEQETLESYLEMVLLQRTADKTHVGELTNFKLNDEKLNAVEIAAMPSDLCKFITLEWVIDKAHKLDGLINRIELLALHFELLRKDTIHGFHFVINAGENCKEAELSLQAQLADLDDDLAFLQKYNLGSEFSSATHLERIGGIAQKSWHDRHEIAQPPLSGNEVYNISIQRGTPTKEERKVVEEHAVHTLNILSQIIFPHSLRNVTEYAARHHERIDGKGYPRGLKGDQRSIPTRIIAIADIFESLTTSDRPYRKGGTLSWAIGIMRRMQQSGHIDGDLFALFHSEQVFMDYVESHLSPEQINTVNLA